MCVDRFTLAFTLQNHIQIVVFLLSRAKQEPVLGETHRSQNGSCVKVFNLKTDNLFFVSFAVPQQKLYLKDVSELTSDEKEESFESIDAMSSELSLPTHRPSFPEGESNHVVLSIVFVQKVVFQNDE